MHGRLGGNGLGGRRVRCLIGQKCALGPDLPYVVTWSRHATLRLLDRVLVHGRLGGNGLRGAGRQPLAVLFVVVTEVGHDHRNRKRQSEHSSHGAQRANHFAPSGGRSLVAIAHRCHGNYAPPKSFWDAQEIRALGVVNRAGENDHSHCQEERQQQEFADAGPECQAEHFEASVVPRELEDSHHPHESEDPEKRRQRGALALRFLVTEPEADEVGQDGHEVDEVQEGTQESPLPGSRGQAGEVFQREPSDDENLDPVEGRVRVRAVSAELRQRLDAKQNDRQQNDANWPHGHAPGWRRRVGVLEHLPDFPLNLVFRHGIVLIAVNNRSKPIQNAISHFEKFQLTYKRFHVDLAGPE